MKTKDYSEKHYSVARITKLFSHPARIQLLDILMTKGYCKSEDMMTGFPIAFTSVSQHLKELRELGLVYKKFADGGVAYFLNEEKFNVMKNQIIDFFSTKKQQ
jgi:ArsR family transcriptional regulator, arsenate/arsenite/antimonite-responsive transcriptional repressor